MKKLIKIIIFTLITFSFVGCFDNEARFGGFPYFNTEGMDSVFLVSKDAQILTISAGDNRGIDVSINYYPPTAGDWAYSWTDYTDGDQLNIIIDVSENFQDFQRTAIITISSGSSPESFDIKVTQEPRAYTEDEIFEGNAILSTREEFDAFNSKEYKEIRGNLIIGTFSSSGTDKTQNSYNIPVEIDGKTYYFTRNTEIGYLNPLHSLRKVSGGIYAVGLNISNLYFLPEMSDVETLVAIHNPYLENIYDVVKLTSLKTLHLNNNNISDVQVLSELKNLETLYLGGGIDETNTISDISALSSSTALKEIHLNYLPIPPYQLNNLSASLPNAKISSEGIVGANPEQIYQGDLLLRTQEDINNFISGGYTEVTGSIIIGNTTTTQPPTYLTNILVNGVMHYITESNSTLDPSALKINHVGEEVYIMGFSNITDLSSISSLSRVNSLRINYNSNLTDISILSNFTNLVNLHLSNNQISDISPLGNLTKLKELYLNGNNISNVDILHQLNNLEILYLGYDKEETNTITSLSNLLYYGSENLKEIYLNYLHIPLDQINTLKSNYPNTYVSIEGVIGSNPNLIYQGDLFLRTQQDVNNFISNGYTEINGSLIIGNSSTSQPQTYLRSIWANNTSYYFTESKSAIDLSSLKISHVEEQVYLIGFPQITDLSMISSLEKVDIIEITHNNNLTDISTLSKFSRLKSLLLRKNKISDISPIGNLTKLYWLNIANENINDITPLLSLSNLTNLYLSQTNVSDISPLSNLTNLTQLSLSYNTNIRDYSHINNMTNLKNLQIYSEHVNDLTPLISRLTNLTSFTLGSSMVSDISPIGLLTKLTHLLLNSNKITDLSALSNLSELYQLQIYNEQISDLAPLYPLKKLNYIYLSDLPLITIANINALTQELPNSTVDHWGINN